MKTRLFLLMILALMAAFQGQSQTQLHAGVPVYEYNGNLGVGLSEPSTKFHVISGGQSLRLLTGINTSGYMLDIGVNDDGVNFYNNSEGRGYNFKNKLKDDLFVISPYGYIGIEEKSPKAQLVVGDSFGASISGSSGGRAVFGSNIAVKNGGANHNSLYTPYSHTNSYGFAGMVAAWGTLRFFASSGNTITGQVITPEVRLEISNSGNVGIGVTSPSSKLEVNGTIRSKKVKVEASPWPDYVFSNEYELRGLEELESFIQQNGHLPEVPSEQEVKTTGQDLGQVQAVLLKKIEELTLYLIEEQKQRKKLENELKALKKQIDNNK